MGTALKIFQDENAFALDDIRVASPCPAEWGDMVGSDTVRFCASCQKNVYNLSGMRRDEAIELLRASEGRTCVRFYRRADGTVLTEDCPVGVALVLRRAKRMTLAAAALAVGALATLLGVVGGTFTKRTCERLIEVQTELVTKPIERTMGEVAMPPPDMGLPPPPPPQPVMGGVPAGQPIMGKMPIRHTMPKRPAINRADPIELQGNAAFLGGVE